MVRKSALVLLAVAPALAGWFGPSTVDECLERHVGGTASTLAVKTLAATCRREFAGEAPPGWQLERDACLRQQLPRAQNDTAAAILIRGCADRHPKPPVECWFDPAPPGTTDPMLVRYGVPRCD